MGVKEVSLSSRQEDSPLSRDPRNRLSVIPTHDRQKGFYSAYFLVPKKTGGFRPILDLRILNQCIARKTFCILTIRRLL